MAAEAIPIPKHFIDQIMESIGATIMIRRIIETTQTAANSIELSDKEAYRAINQTMLENIRPLPHILKEPVENMQISGRMEGITPEIHGNIVKILSKYRIVETQLGHLDDTMPNDMNEAARNEVNVIYKTSIDVLKEMEKDLGKFYIDMMAEQPSQSKGGYRKRKQRTQRKQRKQRKQKHCKTLKRK